MKEKKKEQERQDLVTALEIFLASMFILSTTAWVVKGKTIYFILTSLTITFEMIIISTQRRELLKTLGSGDKSG